MISRRVLLVLASCVFAVSAAEEQAMPDKAERFRVMLLKRPENPVLFGRMIDAWLEQGEMPGLKAALEDKAKSGGAADARLLAMFYEHTGDETSALKALDEAVKRAPEDPAARLARGKVLGNVLRFDEALKDLEIAVKEPTQAVEAGTLTGKYLARAGRPAEAVTTWQKLIAANPADEGLKEDLIDLEAGEGMVDEAIAAARNLATATTDPYQKALRNLRVTEILTQAGKKDETVKIYQEIFAVSADQSWLEREVLARTAALYGREDDAEGLGKFLTDLQQAYPQRVAVRKELAKNLFARGKDEEAIVAFRNLLQILPGNREIREEFAGILEGAGRYPAAIAEIDALLEKTKNDAALWERLAGLKKLAGDPAGMTTALEQAAALMPADETGQVARALLWERFGKSESAETVLRETVKTRGAGGEAGEALATFLVDHGKADEAVGMWRAMAVKADREGVLRISRSLSTHGKYSDAAAVIQSRMKDFPEDPLLLSALCQAAQLGEDPAAARPHALALVKLAKTQGDLESALKIATALAARSHQVPQWIEQLAALKPISVQESCLLAELYESTGSSDQAETVLKAALPGDTQRLVAQERIRLLELRGDFTGAIAAARDLTGQPGGATVANLKKLVDLLQRAGDQAGALAANADWLKVAPGDKQAWTQRADLQMTLGEPAAAVAEIRRALVKFSNDEDLRAKLADAQREAGMNDEAWRTFSSLYDETEAVAGKLKWAAGLARIAESEGKQDTLEKDFRRRARENPTSTTPLLALSEMYGQWQNPEEQVASLEEALRRRPADSALRLKIADLLEIQGSPEKAEALLTGMLGGDAATEARRRLASLWIRQGEPEKGLQELLNSDTKTDPRQVESLVAPLVESGDWENAGRFLDRQSAAHPDDWRLGYYAAVAALQAGHENEAFNRFAALCSAQGDLPGVQPTATQRAASPSPQGQQALQPVAGVDPFPTRIIPQLEELRGMITNIRTNPASLYGNTPGQPSRWLPVSAAQVRKLAALQALEIARANEADRAERLAKIQVAGLEDLAALKRMDFLQGDSVEAELMKPDAEPYDFAWYLYQLPRLRPSQTAGPEQKILKRGIQVCLGRNQELAAQQATYLVDLDPGALDEKDLEPFVATAEKAGGRMSVPESQLIYFVAFVNTTASKELRARAERLVLEMIRQEPGSAWVKTIDSGIPVEMMRQGRYQDAVDRMNASYAQIPGDVELQRADNLVYSLSQSPNPLARVFKFETFFYLSVGWGYQMLIYEQNSEATVRNAKEKQLATLLKSAASPDQAERPPVDLKAFAPFAAKIADPKLRICFLNFAGLKSDATAQAMALLTQADARVSDLTAAAAYLYSAASQPADAYRLMARAVAASDPTNTWRETGNLALIQLAAELDGKDIDLEPAKAAAVKVRAALGTNAEAMEALAPVLEKLGAPPTAKPALARQSGGGGGSSRMGSNRAGGSASSPQLTAQTLARAGKKDQAARLYLAALHKAAGNRNGNYNSEDSVEEMYEQIQSLGLQEEMVKAGSPAEGAGFNRRKEYALMLATLGKKDQALALLRSLVAEKPTDLEVRARLFALLPREEQKQQIEQMAASGSSLDSVAEFFNHDSEDEDDEKDSGRVAMMATFLEKLAPSGDQARNLSWANYAARGIGEDDAALPRLLRAMLLQPQTARQGFYLMYMHRSGLGISEEELDGAATEVLRLSWLHPATGKASYYDRDPWVMYSGNSATSSAQDLTGGIWPADYVSLRRAAGHPLALLDDAFVAGLRQQQTPGDGRAAALKQCLAIVDAPGLDSYLAWERSAEKDRGKLVSQGEILLGLAQVRGRQDLTEKLVDRISRDFFSGDPDRDDLTGSCRILVNSVVGRENIAARTAAMDRVTHALLGPEEAWPLYAELHHSSRLAYLRSEVYTQFASSLATTLDGYVVAVRFINRHHLQPVMSSETWASEFEFTSLTTESLLNSGLFGPGPDLLTSLQPGKAQTLFSHAVDSLIEHDEKLIASDLLEIEGDDRMWARLVGAAVKKDTKAAAAELERNLDTLATWDPEIRQALAAMAYAYYPNLDSSAAPRLQVFLKGDQNRLADTLRQQASMYLKGVPEVKIEGHGLVAKLIPADPVLAAQVWAKFLPAADAASTIHTTYGNSSSLASGHQDLMRELTDGKGSTAALVAFVSSLDRMPLGVSLGGWDDYFDYNFRNRFDNNEAASSDPIKGAFPTEELRNLAAFLAGTAGETPQQARGTLAAVGLCHYYSRYSFEAIKGDRSKGVAWAKALLEPMDPALADAAVMALLGSDPANLKEPDKALLRASSARFLQSSAVAPLEKIYALSPMAKSARRSVLDDEEVARGVAQSLTAYLAAQGDLNDGVMALLGEVSEYRHLPDTEAQALLKAFAGIKPGLNRVSGGRMNGVKASTRLNLLMHGGDPSALNLAARMPPRRSTGDWTSP